MYESIHSVTIFPDAGAGITAQLAVLTAEYANILQFMFV